MIRISILTVLALGGTVTAAVAETPALNRLDMAQFLRTAGIVRVRELSTGITNSRRATLSDGWFTHDAHIQTIDQAMTEFRSDRGNELNFRDCWRYNVAAYRLAGMLGIDDMVPMSVERRVGGTSASVTWWVDDVLMDEAERKKRHASAPDTERWNQQMHMVRVFDQLIFNTDRNLGNLLITKDWRVMMIDHTRAFRLHRTLREPKNLKQCDREMLMRMKALDLASLERTIGPYLNREEIKGLLARRDEIVRFFENAGAQALFVRATQSEVAQAR